MEIKDSIHGYIHLNDVEKELVDSPYMQRLRRIKQLDFSTLVYPSANHTRFEHSLGVMHLAGKFADSLNLNEERRRELRIAALLHDSGHGPFSHTSEMMSKKYGVSHEDFSCEIIDRLEDKYSVDPKRLHKIIRGELEIGQIIAGDIDADRMDYLVRDANSTGVEHGKIDVDTIIRLAEIDSRRLVFDEKAVAALESLLTSRFHMHKSVYRHDTVKIARSMVQRTLEAYLSKGNKLERIMRMDDYKAHNALLNSNGVPKELYKRLRDRRLFKTALKWDKDNIGEEKLVALDQNIDKPKDLERKIADEAGLQKHLVIIDKPSTPDIESFNIRIKKSGDIFNLTELSPIPEPLSKAEWSLVNMSVYCPEEKTEEVNEIAKNILEDLMD